MSLIGTETPDKLIAGITHRVTETSETLTAGSGALARGTVLAFNTVTGKLVPYVEGGTDGAGAFYGILVEDTADLAADGSVVNYKTGQFNANAVIFSGAGSISAIELDARTKGVFFEKAIYNNAVV